MSCELRVLTPVFCAPGNNTRSVSVGWTAGRTSVRPLGTVPTFLSAALLFCAPARGRVLTGLRPWPRLLSLQPVCARLGTRPLVLYAVSSCPWRAILSPFHVAVAAAPFCGELPAWLTVSVLWLLTCLCLYVFSLFLVGDRVSLTFLSNLTIPVFYFF